MSRIEDFGALRRAMQENYEQPEGPARNARAEHLLSEAEKLNVPLAVIEALGHQLKVYNYSSEKDKMFVPFARLLRMWDEHPEDFDEYETHSLHWVFKWVSAGMVGQPHVPLASIEKWLGEMEHRYRLAGHSERAVRSTEFTVAHAIGDLERAERAYTAWLAADRDSMADCHACELHDQGWWLAERGADAEALDLWLPVLEGEYTCAHEPHAVLASSLVPLLRLGRLDEARAHHLRGFRLVRPMESMRGAYADHVEFCALTGNEARALELLAERPAYFTDAGDPRGRLDFLAVAALLMDRLTSLGLGSQSVPGTGRPHLDREPNSPPTRAWRPFRWPGRFDERNGTVYVSGRVRERMDRPPLVERLPLGVRATPDRGRRPGSPRPPRLRAATAAAEPDLAALLAEARRLSAALHPDSVAAWAAVAEAVGDGDLAPRDRAEMTDHEAMGLGPEGVELFARAAELYAAAGDPGEALAARARGAYVLALSGRTREALAAVSEPYERVLALFAEGGTGVRQAASVLVGRARILLQRVHEAAETNGAAGGSRPSPPRRPPLGSCSPSPGRRPGTTSWSPHGPRRRRPCSGSSRRTPGTRRGPRSCSRGHRRRSSRPGCRGSRWSTRPGSPESRATWATPRRPSARPGRRWSTARPSLEPTGHARLHLQLAEILGATGRFGPAADHALEASHWADEGGEGPTLGAWARHQLGGFLLRQGALGGGRGGPGVGAAGAERSDARRRGDRADPVVARRLSHRARRTPRGRRTLAPGGRDRPALARAARPRDARPSRRGGSRARRSCSRRRSRPTRAPATCGGPSATSTG